MKNLKKILTIVLLSSITILSAQDNTRMDKIKAIADVAIANCEGPKYGENDAKTKENLSLYDGYYKQKAYADALRFWRQPFFEAPKSSVNLHIRGIKMYKDLAKKAEGDLKQAYLDTALAIYEVRLTCFGSTAKLERSKAFDWYRARKKGNEDFVYNLFKNTYAKYVEEGKGNAVPANFLLPWADMALRANKTAKTIDLEEVLNAYETISDIVDFNKSEGKDAGKYQGALDGITEMYQKYNIINCESIIPLAEKKFRANPTDETTITKAYKVLKASGCTDSPLFIEVANKMVEIRPSAPLYKFLASKEMKSGNTSSAIKHLNEAVKLEDNDDDKVKLYYQIAKTYLAQSSLSNAREYANKMLSINPNSGEAYIIIGNTYASSGKICGSGNDFNSHSVAWIAIDTWQKAKSVDPSIASEAQKLINRYSQYIPSKEELFYNGLKEGQSYTVKCLGKTTTVRARK